MAETPANDPAPLVLVTGATGFIGQHVILQLLEKGYRVRGTMRSLSKETRVRETLAAHSDRADTLEFAAVDLTSDDGWAEAMEGVAYVQHVASPFPPTQPGHPDEIILPARDGALRALRFAKAAGVKRVVLTSSMAAVAYGHGQKNPPVADETTWSDADNLADNTAYTRSKTIAEKAAWDFMAAEGGEMELSVINPVLVMGPMLGQDDSTSLGVALGLMKGQFPAYLDFGFEVVDVRDVAAAHILAMEAPEAAGERFLVTGNFMMLRDMGDAIRAAEPEHSGKVPRRNMPSFLFRLIALFVPEAKNVLTELGVRRRISAEKAKSVLGWTARPGREAIMDTARDLVAKGLV